VDAPYPPPWQVSQSWCSLYRPWFLPRPQLARARRLREATLHGRPPAGGSAATELRRSSQDWRQRGTARDVNGGTHLRSLLR
jgi:hypothetical protein